MEQARSASIFNWIYKFRREFKLSLTSPHCSGSLNNLQRPRYFRLKLVIDKLKYEKWSKYRPLKSSKRAKNEFSHWETTDVYVQRVLRYNFTQN